MIIEKVLVPFNVEQVNDKDLVIRMLKYEEEYNRENNIAIYQGEMYSHLPDIEKIKRINRATLLHFGFDTSDESVKNYKRIFRTYFRSAEDYDEEVINSSYYMRYNRCVFYVEPIINVGDQIPDCKLLTVDNQEEVSLHNIIKEYDGVYTLVAAFSMT